SGWTCDVQEADFRCATRRTVDPGDKLPSLQFRVAVSTNPAPELVATGQVISLIDANTDNNQDSLRTSIAPGGIDLRITQVAVPGSVQIGGAVDFVIAVFNRGSSRVTGTVVDDLLPRGFRFVD